MIATSVTAQLFETFVKKKKASEKLSYSASHFAKPITFLCCPSVSKYL